MYTSEQIADIIEKKCLALPLDREPKGLFEPIRYIMEDGGKRIRPMLTLLSANLFSDDIAPAYGSAIAIEIFHNFTLLHDDIMDRSPMRRGRETVHLKWDENRAILSGDAMYPLAYDALYRLSPSKILPTLIQEFNRVTMEVCQGQQYDLEFETRQNRVKIEEYTTMIRLKTAVLMATGIKMGAIAANATSEQQKIMYDFGINLGLAFQIQDDLLDTYGTVGTFGKTIGQDIAVGKQTFLKISAEKIATTEQISILNSSRDYIQVREIYDQLNIQQIANQAIKIYYNQAMELLIQSEVKSSRLLPIEQYSMELIDRER